MKILLLNPPRVDGIPVTREDRCEITDRNSVIPPYSLLQLASTLQKKGHEISLVDANGENLSYEQIERCFSEKKMDIMIFRFTPTTFEHDLKSAELAKKRHEHTITIGLCWTLQPYASKVLKSCSAMDIYALGESESTVPHLVDALEQGGRERLTLVKGLVYRTVDDVVYTGAPENDVEYDALPLPAFELVNMDHYYNNTKRKTRFMVVSASKGCPYGCIYCTVRRTKWKAKSAARVVEEVQTLVQDFDVNEISFFDETFTLDRQRTIEICKGLIENDINVTWYCNTRVDRVDPELLRLMRKAGCRGISYGIESGSQQILSDAKKGNTADQAYNAIKWTKNAGIMAYASFMVGLPGESWATVEETINFIKKALPNGAQFNVAVPYPGTELYEIAKVNGWIAETLDWRNLYQHSSMMRTAEMKPDDLDKARRLQYRSLYFNPQWVWENLKFVARNPSDIPFAIMYYTRSLKTYLLYGMKHGH